MHELVGAHGMRHAIQDGLRPPVDDDLAAAAQAQLGAVVVDVLPLGVGTADLGRHGVLGRILRNLDQQFGGILEAAQTYAVATQADVGGVYKQPHI